MALSCQKTMRERVPSLTGGKAVALTSMMETIVIPAAVPSHRRVVALGCKEPAGKQVQ